MSDQSKFGFTETKKSAGPVECLGQTFENDDARREHYLKLLAENLKDQEFRKTPGFPEGSDEDILLLSDPPYYTACPNPFLEAFIEESSKNVQPENHGIVSAYSEDIAAGKHGQMYNVHPYHTKVPPEAIAPLIRHYTKPGDVILDAFCGAGMTGVAASAVAEQDGTRPRKCVLVDLGPAATFIAANYNSLSVVHDLRGIFDDSLLELAEEYEHLFTTRHTGWPAQTFSDAAARAAATSHRGDQHGTIEYTVWSDVVSCPHCATQFAFWDVAVQFFECKVLNEFECPNCASALKKSAAERVTETFFDKVLQSSSVQTKRAPCLISYSFNGKRYEKRPDKYDIARIQEAEDLVPAVTSRPMMGFGTRWGDTWRAGVHAGITHPHHFYTNRNLLVLGAYVNKTRRQSLLFPLTACAYRLSRMNRYMPQHRNNRSREVVGPLSGTLYVPTLSLEVNPVTYLRSKGSSLEKVWVKRASRPASAVCTTQSATAIAQLPDQSVDYVFIDPPFGDNLFYSELSSLWEFWLSVATNNMEEAVVSQATNKDLRGYSTLMTAALRECHRVLKPGRWLTMEFHNSKNAVWAAIAESLQSAGFAVADVSILDKKKGTTKQLSYSNTVNKDLVISAYKPTCGPSQRGLEDGSTEEAWDFIRGHLAAVAMPVERDGAALVNPERRSDLLFDRMVAYHVVRGVRVPLSAPGFYEGVMQRFVHRDSMYFLPDQAPAYDRLRSRCEEIGQLPLFPSDEVSSIAWTRQQLSLKPQDFQSLQPIFMRERKGWASHEKSIEFRQILRLNFLQYDGVGPVPQRIAIYLSKNYREFRGMDRDDSRLKAKALNRWYVPDPKKEGDLEKLRMRTLLKEFEEYRTSATRKIKQFRTEAVRSGFKHCYDEQDYQTIVDVAAKLPEQIIQEDEKLLMYYDVATMRLGD